MLGSDPFSRKLPKSTDSMARVRPGVEKLNSAVEERIRVRAHIEEWTDHVLLPKVVLSFGNG